MKLFLILNNFGDTINTSFPTINLNHTYYTIESSTKLLDDVWLELCNDSTILDTVKHYLFNHHDIEVKQSFYINVDVSDDLLLYIKIKYEKIFEDVQLYSNLFVDGFVLTD